MCTNNYLKFCTCESGLKDKSKPNWSLYSSNRGDELPEVRIGVITLPFNESFDYKEFTNNVIGRINNNILFDFEYLPKEGDLISIKLPKNINMWTGRKIKIILRFEAREWIDLIYSYEGIGDFYVKKIKSGLIEI
jgi:hypothetical protein